MHDLAFSRLAWIRKRAKHTRRLKYRAIVLSGSQLLSYKQSPLLGNAAPTCQWNLLGATVEACGHAIAIRTRGDSGLESDEVELVLDDYSQAIRWAQWLRRVARFGCLSSSEIVMPDIRLSRCLRGSELPMMGKVLSLAKPEKCSMRRWGPAVWLPFLEVNIWRGHIEETFTEVRIQLFFQGSLAVHSLRGAPLFNGLSSFGGAFVVAEEKWVIQVPVLSPLEPEDRLEVKLSVRDAGQCDSGNLSLSCDAEGQDIASKEKQNGGMATASIDLSNPRCFLGRGVRSILELESGCVPLVIRCSVPIWHVVDPVTRQIDLTAGTLDVKYYIQESKRTISVIGQ